MRHWWWGGSFRTTLYPRAVLLTRSYWQNLLLSFNWSTRRDQDPPTEWLILTKNSAWRLHLSITSTSAGTAIIPHYVVDFMVKLPSHMEIMWRWWTNSPKPSGSLLSILCESCTGSQACTFSQVLVVFAYECSSTAGGAVKIATPQSDLTTPCL